MNDKLPDLTAEQRVANNLSSIPPRICQQGSWQPESRRSWSGVGAGDPRSRQAHRQVPNPLVTASTASTAYPRSH